MKLWYRTKRGLNKQSVSFRTLKKYQENWKTINPILETVKLCTSKHSTRDYKHSANVIQKWEQNDLTNSGNLSKLL